MATKRRGILREFWDFLRIRKKWWLAPIIVVMVLVGALLASESYLAIFPASMLRFGANLPPLKVLPVALPIPPWPVGIMTLKNRTLPPLTRLFIDSAREVVRPLTKPPA